MRTLSLHVVEKQIDKETNRDNHKARDVVFSALNSILKKPITLHISCLILRGQIHTPHRGSGAVVIHPDDYISLKRYAKQK